MNAPTITTKEEGTSREQFLTGETPKVIIDADPEALDSVELRQGALVDEKGQRVAMVKPHTWY